ncbi:hypothetical protein Tco_0822482 [Tanacetum coccineum]|uniref:Uncharacterized protein n=1 Tax=Tanacetum coccineum TaxID=301880 RepID=A0ABQ5AG65_9ASTR
MGFRGASEVPTNGPKKRHSVSVGTVTADSVASCLNRKKQQYVSAGFDVSLLLESSIFRKVINGLSDEMRAFTIQDYDGFPFLKLRLQTMRIKKVNEQGSMSAVSMPHSNVVGCESLERILAVMTDKGVSVTAAIMAAISITAATRLTLCIILILHSMSL